jgi:plastocyanin
LRREKQLQEAQVFSFRTLRSVSVLLAGAAAISCGGGKRTGANGGSQTTTVAPPPAGGAATGTGTGKTWDVKMYGDNSGYRFDPKALTISAGDAVRWVLVSGGPHDVTFWADSIPNGAQAQLQSDMPNTIAPLTAPMTMNVGDSYTASFIGLPKGIYHYFCTPHLAMGMVAVITVQ